MCEEGRSVQFHVDQKTTLESGAKLEKLQKLLNFRQLLFVDRGSLSWPEIRINRCKEQKLMARYRLIIEWKQAQRVGTKSGLEQRIESRWSRWNATAEVVHSSTKGKWPNEKRTLRGGGVWKKWRSNVDKQNGEKKGARITILSRLMKWWRRGEEPLNGAGRAGELEERDDGGGSWIMVRSLVEDVYCWCFGEDGDQWKK